jgi:LysM repeat protein
MILSRLLLSGLSLPMRLTRRRKFRPVIWLIVWLIGSASFSACVPYPEATAVEVRPTATITTTVTPDAVYYLVQPDDTLWDISLKLGVDVALLTEVNELESPALLRPGQRLLISDRVTISGWLLPTSTPTPLPCTTGCPRPFSGCEIKGIVSRLDDIRIYLLPDDEAYHRLEADMWFCRESDAIGAGWVRWTAYGPAGR